MAKVDTKGNAPKRRILEALLIEISPRMFSLDERLSDSELSLSRALADFHAFVKSPRTSPNEYLLGGYDADNTIFDVSFRIPGPRGELSINVYETRRRAGHQGPVFTLTHDGNGSTRLREGPNGQAYRLDQIFSTKRRRTEGVSLYECLQDVTFQSGNPGVVYNFFVELPGMVRHFAQKANDTAEGLHKPALKMNEPANYGE